jgi:FixJ family two-component response regulator
MPGQTDRTRPDSKTVESTTGAKTLIYVVDDEAMLLELAELIIQPLGYDVKTFRDPSLALHAFTIARPRPASLITDYAMHSMNGMTLIEACRKLEPNQKVLLLSGTVGPEVYGNSAVKPDQFLEKPYHARQLIDMVKLMLSC